MQMKSDRPTSRIVPLSVAAAALALPVVLWHGGAATGAAAAVVAVAIVALILAPRRALADAAARLAMGVAEAERQAVARIRAAEDEARAAAVVLEALPDAIVELDAERRIVRANRAARELLGAVPGTTLLSAIRDPDILAGVDDALAGRDTVNVPFVLPGPVERHFDAIVLRLDIGAGLRSRAAVLFRDVTALRRADRVRADFVANVSHELRTPLTAVAGFVETLLGPARDDEPARLRFLAIMDAEAKRMTRLVADLLSLSRIEATEHTAPTDAVALEPLIGRAADSLGAAAKAKGSKVTVTLEPGLPPVVGDADQLQQVLQNLVDNAIKYGRSPGEVRIQARRADRPGLPGPAIDIAVADDGEGIARPHLVRLTERFYRIDAGRSRRLGGTGLGLAIVKHIVKRHRGQLTIESEQGKGSVFTVTLPAAAAAPVPPGASQ
jgi:two-component system, OmpR family, phosphate regulon sensor histidine kinase PhoR